MTIDQIQRESGAAESTVLLVDDEPNILSALRRLLRKDGHRIFTAESGAAGLEILRNESVDVIISDQRMPNMTGTEFLRAARDLSPHSVRMVLSGYTELASVTEAINEGAVYKFLTKPWEDEILRIAIREALRHKWMEDENRMLRNTLIEVNAELAESNTKLAQQAAFAENALQRQQHILHDLPIPILGIGEDGEVALSNKAASQLLGVDLSAVTSFAARNFPAEIADLMNPGSPAVSAVSVAGQCYIAHRQACSGDGSCYVIVLVPA